MLKDLYRELIKHGWTLNEIDEADFFYMCELLSEPKKQEIRYMDDDF